MVDSFRLELDIDVNELLDGILELDEEQAFELIKNIDAKMESWQFTEKLYEYFREELKNG